MAGVCRDNKKMQVQVGGGIVSDIKRGFIRFLQEWEEGGVRKYREQARVLQSTNKHTMEISFRDFALFSDDLATLVCQAYYKYEHALNEALTDFMVEVDDQRGQLYEVSFDSGLDDEFRSVRDLDCSILGRLVSFHGTVTRTSEVRPELVVGVFSCRNCGTLSHAVPQQFKYTEPKKCRKPNCDEGSWQLVLEKSLFADFQKIRVQEDPSRIPPGGMPRSIDVVLRNENTERGQPGDLCQVIGYLSVLPQISSALKPGEKTQVDSTSHTTRGQLEETDFISGIKSMRDLSYKLIFCATWLKVRNNQFNDVMDKAEEEEKTSDRRTYDESVIFEKIMSKLCEREVIELKNMRNDPNLYSNLAESLFPTIFGHQDIKKALLLQLLGGIHKKTKNNINLRGDINVLIVGDPSSAKSQFLKCVSGFVPRSVYTNGKTTSAAGLTATVTRDEAGNVTIEAGALMLADSGICCIDEFDKMELKDQVAIHQAMQQQTISIAKAGVYATLNARTSILAAANPVLGRYDKARSLRHNISLSLPLMSRFDLFFVVCDESDELLDSHLADFILNLHRGSMQETPAKYSNHELKTYLSIARKIKPRLTKEAGVLLQRYYIDVRNKEKKTHSYQVTVRHLESMIRISEAIAKLNFSFYVKAEYVVEAYRLLSCTILKLEKKPVQLNDEELLRGDLEKMEVRGIDQLMDEDIRRKEVRKPKQMTISYDLYLEIQRNIITLFNVKQHKHKTKAIEAEDLVSQEKLCNYLVSISFENQKLRSIEETDNLNSLLHSIIRKLINDQMLMVVEDHPDPKNRMLSIHPNFNAQ